MLPPFAPLEKRDEQIYPPFDYSVNFGVNQDYNLKFNAFPFWNQVSKEPSDSFLDMVTYSLDMTLQK